MERNNRLGFTLIELSIVLVIIGLIAGGVMVGRDLIEAASMRQIASLRNTTSPSIRSALNTTTCPAIFLLTRQHKPACLQGAADMATATAMATSMVLCHFLPSAVKPYSSGPTCSAADLIDGDFTQSADGPIDITPSLMTATIGLYLPAAKMGRGYVMVYGYGEKDNAGMSYARENNFQLVEFQPLSAFVSFGTVAIAGGPLTPVQAADLDTKIDDGQPTSGTVTAMRTGTSTQSVALNFSIRRFGLSPPYTDCVVLGPPVVYNTADSSKANQDICSLRIKAGF